MLEEEKEKCERIEQHGQIFYKIYLVHFAEVLGIEDVKGIWKRDLAKYFRKRTNFPIKIGSRGRSYVVMPEWYIKEILKKTLAEQPVYLTLTKEEVLKVYHEMFKDPKDLADLKAEVEAARKEEEEEEGKAENENENV